MTAPHAAENGLLFFFLAAACFPKTDFRFFALLMYALEPPVPGLQRRFQKIPRGQPAILISGSS